jgi:hypothetical protein
MEDGIRALLLLQQPQQLAQQHHQSVGNRSNHLIIIMRILLMLKQELEFSTWDNIATGSTAVSDAVQNALIENAADVTSTVVSSPSSYMYPGQLLTSLPILNLVPPPSRTDAAPNTKHIGHNSNDEDGDRPALLSLPGYVLSHRCVCDAVYSRFICSICRYCIVLFREGIELLTLLSSYIDITPSLDRHTQPPSKLLSVGQSLTSEDIQPMMIDSSNSNALKQRNSPPAFEGRKAAGGNTRMMEEGNEQFGFGEQTLLLISVLKRIAKLKHYQFFRQQMHTQYELQKSEDSHQQAVHTQQFQQQQHYMTLLSETADRASLLRNILLAGSSRISSMDGRTRLTLYSNSDKA